MKNIALAILSVGFSFYFAYNLHINNEKDLGAIAFAIIAALILFFSK